MHARIGIADGMAKASSKALERSHLSLVLDENVPTVMLMWYDN